MYNKENNMKLKVQMANYDDALAANDLLTLSIKD